MKKSSRLILSVAIMAIIISWPFYSPAWAKKAGGPTGKSNTSQDQNDYHFKKKIDPGALQAQLLAAGFSVNYIDCSADNCTIHMSSSETKNPAPIVEKYIYVDLRAVHAQNLETIKSLAAKLDTASISNQERDELLRRLVRHVAGF